MQNTTNMQWGWNYKAMETFSFGMVRFGNVDIYLWIKSSFLFLSCLSLLSVFLSFFFFENEVMARRDTEIKIKSHYPMRGYKELERSLRNHKWIQRHKCSFFWGSSFPFREHSLELAVEGGKPSPPLGLGPRVTKSYSQRGPLNPFFKKEKKKKKHLTLSSDWETLPFWMTSLRMP